MTRNPTESLSDSVSILTDDVEVEKPILDFDKYCNTLVRIAIGSRPKFSMGIYGKWGTGKTTLMRMVEKKLNTFVKEHSFSWSDIISDDRINGKNDGGNVKSFLKEYYDLPWIDRSQFRKNDSNEIGWYTENRISS